jgi:DNA (cytosine-5)-methyltransferase 1
VKPKVLSLFSGVGGFDIGLENAGMETVFQCEWDKHASDILHRHWTDVPKWGDITTLTGKHILDCAPIIDVVAWGSPCQDLSVAGKRAGLKGERSGLFYEGIRIIREIRELTNGKYPRISIWENVAGALSSSKGADFGQVLFEMDEAGACFSEWRLLDAQYFGVPQRRRRVFVVSVFDSSIADRCPNPLLPFAESVRGDYEESVTEGQGSSSTTTESVGGGSASAILLRMREGKDGGGKGPLLSEEKSLTVATANDQTLFVEPTVFQPGTMTRLSGGVWQGVVPTLRAEVKRGDNEPHIAIHSFDTQFGSNADVFEDKTPPLKASQQSPSIVEPTMAVRRLTPLECERLMGWPDNHTKWKVDGTEQADTHRYKQCGNGVASPVAQWIGQKIVDIMKGM